MSRVDVDAEIDEWKRSQEFNNLPHGDELANDFDRWIATQRDSNPHMVKCEECKETKPAEEMYLVSSWFDDEGLCDDCSLEEDVRTDWGIQ